MPMMMMPQQQQQQQQPMGNYGQLPPANDDATSAAIYNFKNAKRAKEMLKKK
jgi:hypothetical protein